MVAIVDIPNLIKDKYKDSHSSLKVNYSDMKSAYNI